MLERKGKQRRVNIIDEYWTTYICTPIRNRVKNADVWAECFFQLTFALSDQQLVTGIAIVVAGLKLYAQSRISVYHFTIVRDLTFFSSSAHLLSMLALWTTFTSKRKQLDKRGNRRRFPIAFTTKWRFFCIFIFFGLVLTVTWITAYEEWDNMYECPATCVPKGVKELGGQPLGWAVATTYLLVVSYTQWSLQLGERIFDQDKTVRRWCRVKSANFDEALQRRLHHLPTVIKIWKGVGKLALLWRFWLFSDATELATMLAWFIANCYWTISDKLVGYEILSDEEWRRENEMGFGQIVPLVLLMLPVMTFIDAYHGM